MARDERLTQQFFFTDCRGLFMSIIRHIFPYEVDYDEFVNEFYLYLMENDAFRLRQFEGRSSIYQWLKTTAIRYFIAKRHNLIDMEPANAPLDKEQDKDPVDVEPKISARIDVETLLNLMSNRRYAYVIKRLILDDADVKEVADELDIKVDNLYNVKKRAIAMITEIALKEIEKYEK